MTNRTDRYCGWMSRGGWIDFTGAPGALALIGAVVGTAAGYIAAIGFFRTNQLDTLSSLTSIPVANLLLILVGMPLVAVIGGWLLAGREPSAIGRRPLE